MAICGDIHFSFNHYYREFTILSNKNVNINCISSSCFKFSEYCSQDQITRWSVKDSRLKLGFRHTTLLMQDSERSLLTKGRTNEDTIPRSLGSTSGWICILYLSKIRGNSFSK